MQRFLRNLIASNRRPLRNVLKAPALKYRDFRFLWVSTFFASIGMMGERVVLGWLVLELSDSALMVGIAMALRMAPFFLLGIISGAVADRVDRKHFMRLLNVGMALSNVGLAVLILLGALQMWHILLLTFVGGSLRALTLPARQSFAYDIVGPRNVVNGLALAALGMRIGGLVGSLLAGLILGHFGADVVYMVMAGGSMMAAIALLPIGSRGQSAPALGHSVWENVKGYVREGRHNSTLRMLVILTAAVEVLGFSYQVLLPSLARDILQVGAEGLGVMTGLGSLGGILGIVLISGLGQIRHKGLLLVGVLHVFGVSITLLAVAGNLAFTLVILGVVSAMAALSDILSQSLMQLAVPNALRGRAMGSWVLAVGVGPLGRVGIGALASAFSVGFALTSSGLALVVLALVSAVFFPRLRRL